MFRGYQIWSPCLHPPLFTQLTHACIHTPGKGSVGDRPGLPAGGGTGVEHEPAGTPAGTAADAGAMIAAAADKILSFLDAAPGWPDFAINWFKLTFADGAGIEEVAKGLCLDGAGHFGLKGESQGPSVQSIVAVRAAVLPDAPLSRETATFPY